MTSRGETCPKRVKQTGVQTRAAIVLIGAVSRMAEEKPGIFQKRNGISKHKNIQTP